MLRIEYQFKRDERLRFLSHLDQQRLFARAFRRAGIEVAYSNGFNPHPKMSFALAMSVGLTSDCEYGEVVSKSNIEIKDFVRLLNDSLPSGLEVVSAWICDEKQKSLSALLRKSSYGVEVKLAGDIERKELEDMVKHLLNRDSIEIEKRNKRGKKVIQNIRPFIENITIEEVTDKLVKIGIDVLYDDQKTVKPELILTSFNENESPVFLIDPTILIHRKDLILENDCF
ncbi:TIGR03936 family radical SAM-associated protein [Eubacteriaceae bacterium ES3]|nr:TIGR03936 family radical SAM-associated protein [Eubacteriaceae bacterium ES3]